MALSGMLLLLVLSCHTGNQTNTHLFDHRAELSDTIVEGLPRTIKVSKDVTIGAYFDYMDSLAQQHTTLESCPLSEHLLVWSNPWIMDTLANTDYYRMMSRDSFVYDQRKMIVLPKGSTLTIPDSLMASTIIQTLDRTIIDVNIPEFRLRILRDSTLLNSFPIRVGQNRKRYLAMDGKMTDLRTKTGNGTIVNHVKDPDFYNPVDGRQFFFTKRDDGRTTLMPQIPWIETEINGVRNGQMIHPTTNPETLGKPYSNGCIGTSEADAWVIYYYAPIGTKIRIRYDLVRGDGSDSLHLKNIYGLPNKTKETSF